MGTTIKGNATSALSNQARRFNASGPVTAIEMKDRALLENFARQLFRRQRGEISRPENNVTLPVTAAH